MFGPGDLFWRGVVNDANVMHQGTCYMRILSHQFFLKTLFKLILINHALGYLWVNFLLNKILSLFESGLYFSGMDSQVLRPMITAFSFPVSKENNIFII